MGASGVCVNSVRESLDCYRCGAICPEESYVESLIVRDPLADADTSWVSSTRWRRIVLDDLVPDRGKLAPLETLCADSLWIVSATPPLEVVWWQWALATLWGIRCFSSSSNHMGPTSFLHNEDITRAALSKM